jgi:hypothetical protein
VALILVVDPMLTFLFLKIYHFWLYLRVTITRPYSKVNKSTRAEVTVYFFRFRFSVIILSMLCCDNQKVNLLCIQAQTVSLLHGKYNYTKPKVKK